jgi:diguanylate cyclase (GGDEF)-like protein
VGGGVREKSLDLGVIEALASSSDVDPFELLGQWELFPVVTREELEEVARKVSGLIPRLQKNASPAVYVDRNVDRLDAAVGLSADIDLAESAEAAIALLSEALGIIFDVPGIAVARATQDGKGFFIHGTWGLPFTPATLSVDALTQLFPTLPAGPLVLSECQFDALFSRTGADYASCFPLVSGTELLGMVALFDTELLATDLQLAALLTCRLASRLAQLAKEEELSRKSSLSARLLSMISSLALIEGVDGLCTGVLKMAAESVHATCGSVMFLDEAGEVLRIEAAIGINPNLARSLTAKIGQGIAGRVAASGHPMLVNDIEKDTRTATHNRPRFKTKSFISIPLRFKERTIGVLNLSDKENQGIYTERDLEVLVPFANHAAALMNRARSLERAELLERLSVTDPLTELFNRRFLEKRIEEELNRGKRHGLHFTILMIDLDYFKIYNDHNGHVAGDKVLKKAARVVSTSVREMDVATRYGGEEFCIVLPDTSKKESLFVADRIKRGIEKETFAGEETLPLGRLTASIGIATFPEDGDTAHTLITAADSALYRAKAKGRNCIVFTPTDDEDQGARQTVNGGQ